MKTKSKLSGLMLCIIVLIALVLVVLAAGCKPKQTEIAAETSNQGSALETDDAYEIAFSQGIRDIDARLGREFKDEEMAEYGRMINASVKAERITASSYLESNSSTLTYKPENVHDTDFQNAWVEGAEENGIWEYVVFHFGRTVPRISRVIIANGYVKSEKTYRENSRPKKLQMYIDDDPFAVLYLQDLRREQIFTFPPVEISGKAVKFEILEVYPGDLYEDTSISEIYFSELPPPDIQDLNVGSVTSGNLNAGQEIWYSVRASTAGILIVETSGSTDTYLEAYDAERNLLAQDDDSAGNGNAKIELMVKAPANYLFKLRGFNSSVAGSYRVMAVHGPMPQMTELNPGSFQNGNISLGDEYWYSVRASETEPLIVETAGNNDTALEARDENFGIITYDNDSGENFNAKVEINAVRGRTYYFKLWIYNDGTGPYRIIANNTAYPPPARLAPGNVLSEVFSPPDEHRWYSVRASQNGLLVVETTGTIDTYLDAYNDVYEFLAYNDDGGEGYNAKVELFVEAGRIYIFRLRALSFDNGASFRIMASNTPYPEPVQLTPGRVLSGNISPGESYWYSVRTGAKGFLVMETTGDIDTYMYAYSDSYKLITTDDDGGEGGNAKIELPVEANQTYIFRLRAYSSETSGPLPELIVATMEGECQNDDYAGHSHKHRLYGTIKTKGEIYG